MPSEEKSKAERYRGKVEDVYSGDDILMMIDLGVDDLHKKKRVRLVGVDTPCAIRESDDSPAGKVRALVKDITRNRECTLVVSQKIGNSWVGTLIIHARDTDINLNELLIARGFQFKREK